MNQGATLKLAEFCSHLSFSDLEQKVVDRAKRAFLDCLGAMLAGSTTEVGNILTRYAKSNSTIEEATIIGQETKTSAPYSSLANGTMAHGLEIDDGHRFAAAHPASVIIPAALAASEKYDSSGKEFITAIVAGYEAMLKIGMSVSPSHRYRHFHPTATTGCFGAAIAVGKLMGLDDLEMASALGIAGTQASGLFEFLTKGSPVKRFHSGKAAFNGFIAAELAREGLKGPDTILEGQDGFFKAFSDKYEESPLDHLGKPFEIMRTYIKPYSCCRHLHAAIDGVRKIIDEKGIRADEIDSIRIDTYKAASYHNKQNIKTLLDAQMSIPYAVAVTVLYDKPSLDQFTPSKINDPQIREYMKKVTINLSEEMEEKYPKTRATQVTLRTTQGTLKSYVEYPKGSPENPLTEEGIITKFKEVSTVAKHKSDLLIQKSLDLTNVENLDELTSLLHP